MFYRLSYDITDTSPVWPGQNKIELFPQSSIAAGGDYNACQFLLNNHFGTHMDAPKHFHDAGQRIAELPLERFIYSKPVLLAIPKTFGEFVTKQDLLPFESFLKEADVVLLYTGISALRNIEPIRFAAEGPAIASEAAQYLIGFENIRSIAVDSISVASPVYPEEAVRTHQILLGNDSKHFICLIEDANLEPIIGKDISRIYSIPLFIEGIDSSPVTILAED